MPSVSIEMFSGHDLEVKRQLVKAVTDAIEASLQTPRKGIRIRIFETERADYAIGGELAVDWVAQ